MRNKSLFLILLLFFLFLIPQGGSRQEEVSQEDITLVTLEVLEPETPITDTPSSQDLVFTVRIPELEDDCCGRSVRLRYQFNESSGWNAVGFTYTGNQTWRLVYPAWALQEYGGFTYYFEVLQVEGGLLYTIYWPDSGHPFMVRVLECGGWLLYPGWSMVVWNYSGSTAGRVAECLGVGSVAVYVNDGVSRGWVQYDRESGLIDFWVAAGQPLLVWKSI